MAGPAVTISQTRRVNGETDRRQQLEKLKMNRSPEEPAKPVYCEQFFSKDTESPLSWVLIAGRAPYQLITP